MQNAIEYKSEIKTVPFGDGKTIVIRNNTPVLNPKERERRKKEIEKRLYNVFSKYRTSAAE